MPLYYPQFDRNEYACLTTNLSCVKTILDLQVCDREIKELEAALTDAKVAAKTQGKGLQKALLEAMKAFDKPAVEDRVVARINQFRSLLNRDKTSINDRELSRTAENLYTDFAKLDTEAFEKFYKSHFGEEVKVSTDYTKEVQSLRARVLTTKQRRERIIQESIANDFKNGVPESFRECRRDTPEEMAEAILMSFYRDWRDRVPLFSVPVTVTGTGIYTLSPKFRETWMNAFRAFGFDRIDRKARLQYLVAPNQFESWVGPSVLRGEESDGGE